jgi:hypothetical protein
MPVIEPSTGISQTGPSFSRLFARYSLTALAQNCPTYMWPAPGFDLAMNLIQSRCVPGSEGLGSDRAMTDPPQPASIATTTEPLRAQRQNSKVLILCSILGESPGALDCLAHGDSNSPTGQRRIFTSRSGQTERRKSVSVPPVARRGHVRLPEVSPRKHEQHDHERREDTGERIGDVGIQRVPKVRGKPRREHPDELPRQFKN